MKEKHMELEFDKQALDQLLEQTLKGGRVDQNTVTGLAKQMTKRLLERALQGELTHHLGYDKHAAAGRGSGNSRNGTSPKTLKGEAGEVTIEVPRDRNGAFEPQLISKHQTRFEGFDQKIISMYARGMSARDIQGHLQELYGVEVSAGLISEVTNEVMEEVKAWQQRPLEPLYPILYLDALYVKIRHEGRVENRAVYVAIGVDWSGRKEVLGLWTSANEGAKFWLMVLTELKNRGIQDVFIACVDGLKGFPQAIETVFPQAQVQACIVHATRASLNYVTWKDRRQVAADLKTIYRAATEEQAQQALTECAAKWGSKYGAAIKVWEDNWERLTPFFSYPEEIRKVIYTTNAVESLNSTLRRTIKTRGSFPNEEAAFKLLFLAIRNLTGKWEAIQHWREALNRFQILWPERIAAAMKRA
ncbi:IS256 family transposase [Verrucomicrobiota bacterium]|nr:IS256 family transposase [Verrucomicrobiota bacterium]